MVQQEKPCELFRYWISINCPSEEMVRRYLVALQEYEGQAGCDPKRTAFLTLKVGEHVRDSGKLKEAIPFFHKALQLRQRIFGEDSGEVAQTINEIGRLYYRLGRNRETLEMWERSLAIREGLEKRSEGDVGVALNNLGLIYHRLGRIRESEEAYQKCKNDTFFLLVFVFVFV